MAGLAPADLEQALAGHPRIGDRSGTDERSRREQARVLAADQATIQALAEGNEDYERRFGHIYLVCATGRNAADLLALLRERLGNDPETEWGVVRRAGPGQGTSRWADRGADRCGRRHADSGRSTLSVPPHGVQIRSKSLLG